LIEVAALVAALTLCLYLWFRHDIRTQNREISLGKSHAKRLSEKDTRAAERTYTKDEVFDMLDQAMVNMDRRRQEAVSREED
jgi:hypothetical protein